MKKDLQQESCKFFDFQVGPLRADVTPPGEYNILKDAQDRYIKQQCVNGARPLTRISYFIRMVCRC